MKLELFPDNDGAYNGAIGRNSSTSLKRSATSRSERLQLRNQAMIARLYYWHGIQRKRLDDVLVILAEHEFFVEVRTIQNAWLELDHYYQHLCTTCANCRALQKASPSWKW